MLQSANSKKFRTLLKNNYYCDQNQRQTTLITLICIKFPDSNHHSAFGWNIATPRVWSVYVGVLMSNLVQIREKSTKINKVQITCQFQFCTYIGTVPQHFQCFHFTFYPLSCDFYMVLLGTICVPPFKESGVSVCLSACQIDN